jgi:hypothetical protein
VVNHQEPRTSKASTCRSNHLERALSEDMIREDFVQIVRDLEDRATHFIRLEQPSPTPLSLKYAEGRLTISSATSTDGGEPYP